jgi:hypothetical protein
MKGNYNAVFDYCVAYQMVWKGVEDISDLIDVLPDEKPSALQWIIWYDSWATMSKEARDIIRTISNSSDELFNELCSTRRIGNSNKNLKATIKYLRAKGHSKASIKKSIREIKNFLNEIA